MGYEKARLMTESNQRIDVLFNPAEYNISKSVTYSDKKVLGMDSPFTQFVVGETETLKLTLMFDTYEPPGMNRSWEGGTNVRTQTDKIVALTEIDPTKHRPPLVTFAYGPLMFKGVITDVNQTFTMFLSDGKPVRAKLEVTFHAIKDDKKKPLESPDRTKCRTVHETQQLWNLAWEEYGDASQWKVIAKENGIMNPLDIKPGQKLKLPAI